MSRFSKSFCYDDNGVISIEFAVVFPLLLLLFLFTMEFSRIMFIGSSLDLMSAQISRKTTLSEKEDVDYSLRFNQILSDEVPLWPTLTSIDNFHVTLQYCETIDDAINDHCSLLPNGGEKMILYTLQYQYYAIFSSFFSSFIDSSLSKKTIVYREIS